MPPHYPVDSLVLVEESAQVGPTTTTRTLSSLQQQSQKQQRRRSKRWQKLRHGGGCRDEHNVSPLLLDMACQEMAEVSSRPSFFPPACLELVRRLAGNDTCVDCGGTGGGEWASVSFGTVLCIQCCGHHRGLGVGRSVVRSLTMDHWTEPQILQMLEGGNQQFGSFMQRHGLQLQPQEDDNKKNATPVKSLHETYYKTKAATFYRQELQQHVQTIRNAGPYQGRQASRNIATAAKQQEEEEAVQQEQRQDTPTTRPNELASPVL